MADDNNTLNFFGFQITKSKKKQEEEILPSLVPPNDEDGAGYVTASGAYYGSYINLDGENAKDDRQQILKYREVASHPDVDMAIEDIVNEAVSGEDEVVKIKLDKLQLSPKIKKTIELEFENILKMMKFRDNAHDIFRRFYIDGRLFNHLIINTKIPQEGIIEIRNIDSTKIKKVKEVKKDKDPVTGANIIKKVDEYFVFSDDSSANNTGYSPKGSTGGLSTNNVKIFPDAISYVTSGLLDPSRKKVVSYLHKVLKPLNQLKMMEDSLVIYRLARAPERRVFYIDVGTMQKGKAEEYIKGIITKYRNKTVYDANTGELKTDQKHMSMLEDFWFPRMQGNKGTEVTNLEGGANLGEIEDIIYFQKRLYRALNVPLNRLEQEAPFSLGRSTEISRDELKFQKFIDRLRRRFNSLFYEILKKQLILKQVLTEEDWKVIEQDIEIEYVQDNHFAELRDAELIRERLAMLEQASQFTGQYLSRKWIRRNILKQDDDLFEEMNAEMEQENQLDMQMQQQQMMMQQQAEMQGQQRQKESLEYLDNKNIFNE